MDLYFINNVLLHPESVKNVKIYYATMLFIEATNLTPFKSTNLADQ